MTKVEALLEAAMERDDIGCLHDALVAVAHFHAAYGLRVGRAWRLVDPKCVVCEERWPCATLRVMATALEHFDESGEA